MLKTTTLLSVSVCTAAASAVTTSPTGAVTTKNISTADEIVSAAYQKNDLEENTANLPKKIKNLRQINSLTETAFIQTPKLIHEDSILNKTQKISDTYKKWVVGLSFLVTAVLCAVLAVLLYHFKDEIIVEGREMHFHLWTWAMVISLG